MLLTAVSELDATEEGSGLVHWAIVDLAAPGIELYVTPLDPQAVARGWQYRLRRIGDVVDKESLAVVVNGTLFGPDSGWWPWMTGDLANGVETVVADHVVSHLWEHTYLLWFDDQLTPHLRPSKPPTTAELSRAKWGSADRPCGCTMAKFRKVAAVLRIRELRWPSINSANFCSWRWAKISRPTSYFRSLPI